MKKIKLLTPILGLTALSSAMIPLASCSCNKGEDKKEEDDVTKHVTESHQTPVEGTDFVVTYNLDSGYSLDLTSSKITFADSNVDITNEKWILDATNKKITIPGKFVESTSVTVSLKSMKTIEVSKTEAITQINNIIGNSENKNYKCNWTNVDTYSSPYTQTCSLEAYGSNCHALWEDKEFWGKKQEDNIGWWSITKNENLYYAYPTMSFPIFFNFFGWDLDVDDVLSQLTYNKSTNSYFCSVTLNTDVLTLQVFFNKDKKVENIKTQVLQSSRTITQYLNNIVTGGASEISVPKDSDLTKDGYASEDQFTYTAPALSAQMESTLACTYKAKTPDLVTKLTGFDATKTTYLLIDYVAATGYDYKNLYHIYNGSSLLDPSTYSLKKTSTNKYYFEINPNTLTGSEIKLTVQFAVYLGGAGQYDFKIQQEIPA